MTQPQSEPTARDRRTQARIQLQIPVEVTMPGCTAPVSAITQNISWGGMLLLISEPLPARTGPLRIVLPWKRDERITADVRLLRAIPLADGQYLIAVRFMSLSPRGQARLERLLKMLRAGDMSVYSDDGGSLFRELEVTVNDADELRQMLGQIAEGRYRITVFDAYEADQSISLVITGTRDLPGIRLRARVVDVQRSTVKDFDWTELYTLSLQFEHPRKAIKAFVKLLLDQLPSGPHSAAHLDGAPEWLRSLPLAKPSKADLSRLSGRAGLLSTLEREFPESINQLVAGWGDADAFEIMFRELTLGEHGHPGGWPEEAWAELEMLQRIHDEAYGVPGARMGRLRGGRCA